MESSKRVRDALGLLSEAKRLKRMTLPPEDPNYEDKLHLLLPFLNRFSESMGMSSASLSMALRHRDARYAHHGFHASDFDDWCRCLHKMSLVPVPCLADCLRALQKTDHQYARLIHNLAQSVYVCLLYWCVPPQVLVELARRASLNQRKCVEALTVNDLCTAKDWTIVPPSHFYPWSIHPPALARVFETTYETLGRVEMEPHATPCCSLVPKCPRLLGRLWRRHVVSGRRVDALEDVFERLDLGEVKLEDIFHLLTVEGRTGTLLGTRAPSMPWSHA